MIKEHPVFEVIGPGYDSAMAFLLLNRVCGDGTAEEAEAWIRKYHPAGTSGNWHLSNEDHRKPVVCGDDPNRTHYMFEC